MPANDNETYKRSQKKFNDIKPGDRFHFMGEWHEMCDCFGFKAGMWLTDQRHPQDSEASPLRVVFPRYGSVVTVIH